MISWARGAGSELDDSIVIYVYLTKVIPMPPFSSSDDLAEAAALIPEAEAEFYRTTMRTLQRNGHPFLVAGTYAMSTYTDIVRDTKDFDIFVRAQDLDAIRSTLEAQGYRTGLKFPHWLAKVYCDIDGHGEKFVDLIFRSGNGVCSVEDAWWSRAIEDEVLGVKVKLCPPEEILWTKAYIMERERYDGADVAHIIHGWAERMNWDRLLDLFGEDWRVLLSHLTLFGYIYPGERDRVPEAVMQELIGRLWQDTRREPGEDESDLCQGTLLSRQQYLIDVQDWDYEDARLRGDKCEMSERDIALWTEGIEEDGAGDDDET